MMNVSYEKMMESDELVGNVVDVYELLDLIRGKWGDLDNESGCYCNGNWMSVKDFVDLIVENSYPDD